jgi:hypothetical protein
MPPTELIERYASGPKSLRQVVAGLNQQQLLARPIPRRWSTMEVVAHLADFEVISVDRLTAIIAEQDPVLPGRDEQQYAARLSYHDRDVQEQLQLIELCRSHVLRILRTVPADCWSRQGLHTEAGPLTLTQQLQRTVNHLEHHLPFVQEKRLALQSPVTGT